MINVSLEAVKELRDLTGLGLNECKQALLETAGDVAQAVTFLQKKNKTSDKNLNLIASATEGAVFTQVFPGVTSDHPTRGVIFELNCQTDFAANSQEFKNLLPRVAQYLSQPQLHLVTTELEEMLQTTAAVLKEKLVLTRSGYMEEQISSYPEANSSLMYSYNHPGNKIAVLLELNLQSKASAKEHPALTKFAEDLALQIAAMRPRFLDRSAIPSAIVEQQVLAIKDQLREMKKPEIVWEKIIEGKLNSWYSEICLLEQQSIFSQVENAFSKGKATVQTLLNQLETELGLESTINISFRRYERGERLGFLKYGT